MKIFKDYKGAAFDVPSQYQTLFDEFIAASTNKAVVMSKAKEIPDCVDEYAINQGNHDSRNG